MSDLRSDWVAYRCSNDCEQAGCPSHRLRLVMTDPCIYYIEVEGQEKDAVYFDEDKWEATLKAFYALTHTLQKTTGVLTLHFDELGGYDCMSDAWLIERGGETVVVVDVKDFGPRRYNMTAEEAALANEEARLVAEKCFVALGGTL